MPDSLFPNEKILYIQTARWKENQNSHPHPLMIVCRLRVKSTAASFSTSLAPLYANARHHALRETRA